MCLVLVMDASLLGHGAIINSSSICFTMLAMFLAPILYYCYCYYYYPMLRFWTHNTKAWKELHGATNSGIKPSQHNKNSWIKGEENDTVERKLEFLKRVGPNYGYSKSPSGPIDTWRSREFPKLLPPIRSELPHSDTKIIDEYIPANNNEEKEVYLDYAGAALTSQTQLQNIFRSMISGPMSLLGNPHSSNSGPASARTSLLIEQAKTLVLDHFHCHPDLDYYSLGNTTTDVSSSSSSSQQLNQEYYHPGYDIIFTSGATEALRILATSFPWTGCSRNTKLEQKDSSTHRGTTSSSSSSSSGPSSVFIYPHNSHTSLVGIRGPVMAAGASFRCFHLDKICTAEDRHFFEWATTTSAPSTTDTITSDRHSDDKHHHSQKNDAESIEKQPISVPLQDSLLDVVSDSCIKHFDHTNEISHLLAIPLECNFGGDVIPAQSIFRTVYQCNTLLSTLPSASSCPARKHRWYTLLDIASAASHSPINLKKLDPDFACISFYKMFGYPTGLGALFVKRSTGVKLLTKHRRRSLIYTSPTEIKKGNNHHYHDQSVIEHKSNSSHAYYGGGSVDAILPHSDFVVPKPQLSAFVNGTVHFQGIASLSFGFQELSRVGGVAAISIHSRLLASELVRRFKLLHHENGCPAIKIYGAWNKVSAMQTNKENGDGSLPGPTVAFNVIRFDGSYVGYNEISKMALLNDPPLQLRAGCFCNVGACQEALVISDETFKENYFVKGHVCGDHNDIISGKPTGAVRASFGKDSCWEDVDALVIFLQRLVINEKANLTGLSISSNGFHSSSQNNMMNKGKEMGTIDCPWIIRELYVYPIKGCAPMRVKSWRINVTTGQLEFDREFALVTANGVVMRLQSFPQLAKIYPLIDIESKMLTVTAPGVTEDLVLCLEDYAYPELTHDVNVCGNEYHGKIFGSRISAAWFTSVLGVRCWLVRFVKKINTPQNGDEKEAVELNTTQTELVSNKCHSFSNEAPLLLISQQAVNILNHVLQAQDQSLVSSRHFRPNFVLDVDANDINKTAEPISDKQSMKQHPEDLWSKIQILEKDLEFSVLGPCARCSMVDINPITGMKEHKALSALAEYRRTNSSINFGIFLSLSCAGCAPPRKKFCVINEGNKVAPTSASRGCGIMV